LRDMIPPGMTGGRIFRGADIGTALRCVFGRASESIEAVTLS